MSGYPGLRASDEDRSRAAAALDQVYAATTLGELDHLMAAPP
jgi:hypothetical protein